MSSDSEKEIKSSSGSDGESSDDTLAISSQQKTEKHFSDEFRTIRCTKETSLNIRGKRIYLHFKTHEGKEYTAKIKNFPTNSYIYIASGTDCHISADTCEGVILRDANFSSFSLRESSINGIEKCAIEFKRENESVPHSVTIHIFGEDGTKKLVNAKPKKNVFGLFEVDLNAKVVIRSSKNFRIVDEDKNPVIFTRKVEPKVLEIEGHSSINDLTLIAIGCAVFLTRV